MKTIIDHLEHWAAAQPGARLSSFLDEHGGETDAYTYLEFHERTSCLAAHLSRQGGIRRGDRILLVYPAGLEVIVAFFACARIGAISVPVQAPTPMSFEAGLAKLAFVARDCEAKVALTTSGFYQSYQSNRRTTMARLRDAPAALDFDWMTTDNVRGEASIDFKNDPDTTLFLQYSSGSTGDPKGVVVSHDNVIQNCLATIDHKPTGVSWLPQYHDMGLIGYYLFPAIMGGMTYGLSPLCFLKRPVLWLQTLSRVRATYASSPNFGFEYCLREDKVPSSRLGDVDLSNVRVFMNASEPVCAETYDRFFERFARYGLRPQAHVAAYGLAENTLAATHYGRRMVTVDNRRLVSCGKPLDGIQLRIVNPQSHAVLANGEVGEIWLSGTSTCQGYWNRPDLTKQVFENPVANDVDDQTTYLRTGDLGFLDNGELFVCGRIKDVIIIRGINYYPHDIERIVESTSPNIRSGGVVAFEGRTAETLVVVVEQKAAKDNPDAIEIVRAIRTQYDIEPETIVFVPPRTIAKTSSGKVARSPTRRLWLASALPVIATHTTIGSLASPPAASSTLWQRLRSILEPYDLKGHEHYTLADIGVDSLSLVMLVGEIEQRLEQLGFTDLTHLVDGRFLQRLRLADLGSLLDHFEKASAGESVASLKHVMERLKKHYDADERDCMRRDAEFEPFSHLKPAVDSKPITHVLLTGATGFFGPFLLRSLLLHTPHVYSILIRAADPLAGRRRIRDALRHAGIWTPALNEQLDKRVHIVCGDITRRNLGVCSEAWALLTARVQAVIHNAALVNYVSTYDSLRPHNVDGTRELLRLSCTGTGKEFHLVSSTIIFGWTSKAELLEADNNQQMTDLDFGYAQSKWVAEQLVRAAQKQGLKARIYRPAFISASSSGIASKNDIIIRLLAFMISQGVAVNSETQMSFLPADVVADNLAAIFMQRRSADDTLHLTADSYYNMSDITRLITKEYGYSFVYYDMPGFITEMNRRCSRQDPLYPLLDFFNRSHRKAAAMRHKRYNNDRYRKARALAGRANADPPLKTTLSYLMAYMLRQGLIPGTRLPHTDGADSSPL